MYERFDSVPPRSAPEYTRPPDEIYDEGGSVDFRRHQVINHVVTDQLVNRITGRGPGQQTLYGVNPKIRFFAATLASQYRYNKYQEKEESEVEGEDDSDDGPSGSIVKNVSPFKAGIKLKIDPDELNGPLRLHPQANLYYKRFPTYREQLKHSDLAEAISDEESLEEPEPELAPDGGPVIDASESKSLVSVYERLNPQFDPIEFSRVEFQSAADSNTDINRPLSTTLEAQVEEFKSDERAIRVPNEDASYDERTNVPGTALQSEDAFEDYLSSTFTDEVVRPLWSAAVHAEVERRADGHLDISVALLNTHGDPIHTAVEAEEEWQTFLFDARLSVEASGGAFVPFESEKIKDRYQYDGDIYGVGQNCSVEPVDRDPVTEVRTNPVPIFRQPKYVSRETVSAPFAELSAGNFESILETIEEEMKRAYEQYREVRTTVTAGKTSDAEAEYDRMLEQFEDERRRFQQGKEVLLNDENENAREAFAALNKSFKKLGEEYQDWRLFQIIYIVMSIPDIVAQADPSTAVDDALDVCDIIFFPTGGGKTEAYLGLVVFSAFLDRLRGKNYGVTALTKFPLRLLSLQQLQRIANVLCNAEEVRRKHPDMEGESFSVGYFVGKNNTPNKIFDEGDNAARLAKESDDHKEKWLIVPKCPFCNQETVDLTGDLDRRRVVHQCTNSECPEVEHQGGETAELPIYITDNEVYRHVPTFVVSTIDKIAVVGMNRRARGLFGQVKYRCPDHGYTTEEGCLAESSNPDDPFSCSHSPSDGFEDVGPTDPPSILIQDELHLLREDFGAFDSHYETLIQELINQYTDGEWQMKVVAATATIEGAENQVRSLYRSEPNKFPSQGPRLRQSFYAYEDPHRLGRQMIGAIPRSIGASRAMNIVMREYARTIQYYDANPDQLAAEIETVKDDVVVGPLDFSNGNRKAAEIREALEDYHVQIGYTISKSQSDLLQRSVDQMINRQLDAYGPPHERLTPVSLTGETDMDQVRDALSRLEADDPDDPIDVVIATSMISHGVDVNAFNFISFHGMPRNTAEYIQAYSRVGRKYTGSVFLLFDAMRARDRSHYGRFNHYHQYQDLLVEATPLERWAEFAIECTLPGIVVGILLQYYDLHHETDFGKRIYNVDGFREACRSGIIDEDELLEFVYRAYDVDGVDESKSSEIGARLYRERIESQFGRVWDRLQNADPDIRHPKEAGIKKFIGNILDGEDEDERGPMRSLRDIDEQIPIYPDLATEDLVEMISGVEEER